MKDVVGNGEMWSSILLFSACVSVMTVPAGLVLALNGWPLGWLLIVLTVPVIAVLFIVGNLIAKSDVAMLAAGVVGWLAGVVAGVALLVFGIDAIVNFEPECEPSAEVECRWIITSAGGTSTGGEATVSEQRRDATIDAVFWQIVPGTVLLMAWAGFGLLRFARDRRDAPTTSPEP